MSFNVFQPNYPTSVSLDVKAHRSHKKTSKFEYQSDVKATIDNKDYHVILSNVLLQVILCILFFKQINIYIFC